MSKREQIAGLVVSLLIVFGVAFLGQALYRSFSQHVVSDPCEAVLDSFRGYDWYGMDYPLHLDGYRCVDRLAPRRGQGAETSLGDLCYTAPPELRVVGSILRSPEPGLGTFRNRRLMDCDSRNCGSVLESLEAGGNADGALSDLGQLRRGSERHDLAAERMNRSRSHIHKCEWMAVMLRD
jgi:hypothetical protein